MTHECGYCTLPVEEDEAWRLNGQWLHEECVDPALDEDE